jgi:alpha-tubulin suppressor-like RCC1 family protein
VTCGLTTAGAAYCWGPGNEGGLGNGSSEGASEPIAVATSLIFTSIAVGDDHACALADGDAYCWGRGAFGKLGLGMSGAALVPALVAGGHRFAAISVGSQHSCALTDEGLAFCWGFGDTLGNGAMTDSDVPVAVSGDQQFQTIHAGFNHTCALTAAGEAFCWAQNLEGALGDGTTENAAHSRRRQRQHSLPCARRRSQHLRHRRERRGVLLGR